MQVSVVDPGSKAFNIPVAQRETRSFSISQFIKKMESIKIAEAIIQKIDQFEAKVIDPVPHLLDVCPIEVDKVLNLLRSKLEPITQFNEWLDTNQLCDEWDSALARLAGFLVKLPLRVVRNIVNLVVSIVKAACYAVVHPLKATTKLAKLIVKLAAELTKPETWSKIGVGILGASLANLATLNMLTIVGFIVGGALMIGGITVGALLEALKEETGEDALRAATLEAWRQVQQLPEVFLTSFCIGLIVGGIQKAVVGDYTDPYLKKWHLPKPEHVETDMLRQRVDISWSKWNRDISWQKQYPEAGINFNFRTESFFKSVYYNPGPVWPTLLTSSVATAVQ